MDSSQIVDALSGSFFALLGIWAAVGERQAAATTPNRAVFFRRSAVVQT